MRLFPSINVLGHPLEDCSHAPKTGFYRDGCCNTGEHNAGVHAICIEVTDDFLIFSRSRGNDLSTPRPEFNFPGLKAGDRWCLSAPRYREALEAGMAPRVFLRSTHRAALAFVSLADLAERSAD